MTALPAPHCFSFSLFYTLYPHALSHALARAPPYCSPSHVIVPSAHCFPMYLASFDRHLETLVSTSCLQVSPHILRSVDTSLNTFLSPALPVEPSSSLAAQRPARRSCLSRSSSPLRSTSSRNTSGNSISRLCSPDLQTLTHVIRSRTFVNFLALSGYRLLFLFRAPTLDYCR